MAEGKPLWSIIWGFVVRLLVGTPTALIRIFRSFTWAYRRVYSSLLPDAKPHQFLAHTSNAVKKGSVGQRWSNNTQRNVRQKSKTIHICKRIAYKYGNIVTNLDGVWPKLGPFVSHLNPVTCTISTSVSIIVYCSVCIRMWLYMCVSIYVDTRTTINTRAYSVIREEWKITAF